MVISDNGKQRLMYYDLQGKYIKKSNFKYRFVSQFEMLPSSGMVFATNKSDGNVHFGKYDDYRLIYTDTIGTIKKFGFIYDDNFFLKVGWSKLFLHGDEILYLPNYSNNIYSVSDTLIRLKYTVVLDDMSQFDINTVTKYRSIAELDREWYSKANVFPKLSENNTHLYFSVDCRGKKYYYFYDKRTENVVGLEKLLFDSHFMMEFPTLYSYQDYFVGTVKAESLKELKEINKKKGTPMPPAMAKMVDNLDEEDNDVLVMFKLKKL